LNLIPSIDILDGRCVRLYQGDYDNVTVYSSAPEEIAGSFEEAGAKRIHVVDLDAAKGKGQNNRHVIGRIRKAVGCIIDVGGGIRSLADIEELFGLGIDRLVLGTVIVRDPAGTAAWASKYGDLLTAGIDARDGVVRVQGWNDDAGVSDLECVRNVASMGFSEIIYTSIAMDGVLAGPDIERTSSVARESSVPVVLSGGIGSYDDIERAVRRCDRNVLGIIIGKAIYEGRISVHDAILRFET
jgi:phosphoribosylformimino-5-aminoimidazole carboxamide ribotide isomerase